MIIILLGAPGSGKGTQSLKLENKFLIKRLSTGDVLRKVAKEDSDFGREIKKTIDSGNFIQDGSMLEMLESFLTSNEYSNGAILDGFPRTLAQVNGLSSMLNRIGKNIVSVIELKVDENILKDRLIGRFYCVICNENYHKIYKKPSSFGICDICGSSSSFVERVDDEMNTMLNRLKIYKEHTNAILNYYLDCGLLDVVDGMQSIEKVTSDIELIIHKRTH